MSALSNVTCTWIVDCNVQQQPNLLNLIYYIHGGVWIAFRLCSRVSRIMIVGEANNQSEFATLLWSYYRVWTLQQGNQLNFLRSLDNNHLNNHHQYMIHFWEESLKYSEDLRICLINHHHQNFDTCPKTSQLWVVFTNSHANLSAASLKHAYLFFSHKMSNEPWPKISKRILAVRFLFSKTLLNCSVDLLIGFC